MHFVNLAFQSYKFLADLSTLFSTWSSGRHQIRYILRVQMAKNWSSAVTVKKNKRRKEDKEMSGQDLIMALTDMPFCNIVSGFFYCFSSMRNSLKDRECRNRGFSLTTIIKLNLIKPFYYFLLKANIFSIFFHA